MALPSTLPMRTIDGIQQVPCVGFGTWAFGDTGWCYKASFQALRAGYRHLDCAWNYGTDDQVGAAIRDSGIPRKDIFITTKFWPNWGAPENVERCLDACLKDMKLEYIDLYLAHWPLVLRAGPNLPDARATSDASNQERGIAVDGEGNPLVDWQHTVQSIASDNGKIGSFEQTWKAMQSLVTLRKTRAIGVSNFNVQQLKEVMSFGGNVPLSCNQVESHPWFQNAELLQFMKSEHILSTVFCPFAGQQADGKTLVKDPSVRHMAAELDMGVGQLLQSWAVQRGTIPLGKSQHEGRIKENLAVRKIPDADFEALSDMDKGDSGRTVDLGPEWGVSFF